MNTRLCLTVVSLALCLLLSACKRTRTAPTTTEGPALEKVRRAAFDFGSGSMKLRVHDVLIDEFSTVANHPVRGGRHFIRVDYEEDLKSSTDGRFSSAVMARGIEAAKELRARAERLGATEFAGLAMGSFRRARNGQEFVRRLFEETDINLRIVTTEEEARLGYLAARASLKVPPRGLVVWDIGGSTMTLTTREQHGAFVIHRIDIGSATLRDRVMREIQNKPPSATTPNPMTLEDLDATRRLAGRFVKGLLPPMMTKRLADPDTTIVGIGPAHFQSVRRLLEAKGSYSRTYLANKLRGYAGRTDAQIGGEYPDTDVVNLALVLETMRGLGFQEVRPVNVNIADGILYALYYW